MYEYAKRLAEVDVIINLLPEEDYNKIPKDSFYKISHFTSFHDFLHFTSNGHRIESES